MDARIEKTREKLMKALSELSQTQPVERISVSELCKKAGVNRTTFYKYYHVPADIGREAFEEHMGQLLDEIHGKPQTELYGTMLSCCRLYRENYVLTRQIFPGYTPSREVLEDFYLRLNEPSQLGDRETLYFIAGGCAAVVEHWLTAEPDRTPEETARKLTQMILGVLK